MAYTQLLELLIYFIKYIKYITVYPPHVLGSGCMDIEKIDIKKIVEIIDKQNTKKINKLLIYLKINNLLYRYNSDYYNSKLIDSFNLAVFKDTNRLFDFRDIITSDLFNFINDISLIELLLLVMSRNKIFKIISLLPISDYKSITELSYGNLDLEYLEQLLKDGLCDIDIIYKFISD